MNTFERSYHSEPIRESDCEREHASIEISDEEYLRRANYVKDMTEPSEFNPMMPEALDMADQLIRKKDAKSKSKAPKSKSKKDNSKLHKSAVESVQEEL